MRTRLRIRAKVLLVLVVLASLCSVVVATTLLSFFQEDRTTYIQELNIAVAVNTASSVDVLLQLYRERMGRVAEIFNARPDPAASLNTFFQANPDLVYLAVYNSTGDNVLHLIRDRVIEEAGIDLAAFHGDRVRMDELPSPLADQGLLLDNSSLTPRLLTLAMYVPFESDHFAEPFSIRIDFRSSRLLSEIERAPGFSTYVVDRVGRVLLHSDPEVMAVRPSFAGRPVVETLLIRDGLRGSGSGEFDDDSGKPMLASYAALPNAGLGVIVEWPRRDAYLATDRLSRRSMQAAPLLLLLSILLSVPISRALTAPLLDLSRAAGRLERGDFDAHVEPRSTDELGDLARSFNLAARGLKERDLKLKETYEQLLQSEKLAGFGKFAAGMAHELKNPLTGIIGFCQLLQRKAPADSPSRRPLELMEKEAKRCRVILDNLLKFTRKEGFHFAPVRLHAHIAETLDLLEPQLNVHGVRLVTELEAADDLIRGDANQLRQVFMNLLLNAIDALEGRETKEIRITTRLVGEGRLDVLVSDTGPGIPAQFVRRVFDPFFTTKEPGKGTGLGLSVSYGIVTNHGGKITVRSDEGQGTEFQVSLPTATSDVRGAERKRTGATAVSG